MKNSNQKSASIKNEKFQNMQVKPANLKKLKGGTITSIIGDEWIGG